MSKSKQSVLERLGASEVSADHRESPERLQAVAEIFEWLEARRRQVNIPANSPQMREILAAVQEHRDFLNEQWCDGSENTFKDSLHAYARAVSQEMLRTYKNRQSAEAQEAMERHTEKARSEQTSLEDA